MTSEHGSTSDLPGQERVGQALAKVAELGDLQREIYLERLDREEPSIAAEVRDLLPHYLYMRSRAAKEPAPETVIGGYELIELLGEGGFGQVWRAHPRTPGMPHVAIKLIKAGLDTNAVLRRFDRERAVLARLNHTGIASILDAGRTDAGRPFIVMELVHGVVLTEFVKRKALSQRRVLELFIRICRAVEHAHHHDVLHRDLTPSNVLVVDEDDLGLPKVIDFGIAAALFDESEVDRTRTRDGQIVGTVASMSPEQAGVGGHCVDVRTDVFGLGRILHELLAGEPAVQLATVPADQVLTELRRVLTDRPPSVRGAARRNGREAVPGPLERIVETACASDAGQRYRSVRALREDVERFLIGEPIAASRPSALSRMIHHARRHRAVIVPAAGIVAVLAAALMVSLDSRARAIAAIESMEQTIAFQGALVDNLDAASLAPALLDELRTQVGARIGDEQQLESVLATIDQHVDGISLVRSVLARGVLDPAEQELMVRFADDASRWSELALKLINKRKHFGLLHGRGEAARASLEHFRQLHGSQSREVIDVLLEIGGADLRLGKLDAARAAYEEVADLTREVSPSDNAMARFGLAQVESRFGHKEQAIALFRELLSELEAAGLAQSHTAAKSRLALGDELINLGQAEEAASQYERGAAIIEEAGLAREFDASEARIGLARARLALGDAKAASEQLELAIRELRGRHGEHAEELGSVYSTLADCRMQLGEIDGALSALELSTATFERRYGPTHPYVLMLANNRAHVLNQAGRFEDSIAVTAAFIPHAREAKPPMKDVLAALLGLHAGALAQLDRLDEALPLVEESIELATGHFQKGHPQLAAIHATARSIFGALAKQRPGEGFDARADAYR